MDVRNNGVECLFDPVVRCTAVFQVRCHDMRINVHVGTTCVLIRVFPLARVGRRGWLPQDAAGAPRERVSSKGLVATTFYQQGATRPQYPGQRELMGDILYGQEQMESSRRSDAPSARAFSNAAGYKHNVTDLPEAADSDRHPHLQRAIRADDDRRCAMDSIAHVSEAGLSSEAGAPEATVTGWHKGRPAALPPSAQLADKATDLIYHPQYAAPTDLATPRRLLAPGGALVSATHGPMHEHIFPGPQPAMTPRAARHDPAYDGAAGSVVPDTFTHLSADGANVWAAQGQSGKKVWGAHPPATASSTMAAVLAHGADSTTLTGYASHPNARGVAKVRIEPAAVKPHGRASGFYNPGVSDGPTVGLANDGARVAPPAASALRAAPPAEGGGGRTGPVDAGVASYRLHELESNAHPVAHTSYGAGTSHQQHQKAGAMEKRAGGGPRCPMEQRVCGLSRRRADPDLAPQVAPRNPMCYGEAQPLPAENAALHGRGRVHLAWDAMAAQDHLDGSTLVPDRGAEEVPAGIATGERARQSHASFGGDVGRAATAGWSIDAKAQQRYHDTTSRRKYTEPPRSLDLAHVVAPAKEAAAPATPAPKCAPAVGATPTGGTSSRRHDFDRCASSRATAEVRSEYSAMRQRSRTSTIFEGLNYPTGAAVDIN